MVYAHPDGETTGLMPIGSVYDSTGISFVMSTASDSTLLYIQKYDVSGTLSWSMFYNADAIMNKAVMTSDDAYIRMLVKHMDNDQPLVIEIDTSKLILHIKGCKFLAIYGFLK